MTKTERFSLAIALCNAALTIVRRGGTMAPRHHMAEPSGGFAQASAGTLDILYRTPFAKWPQPSEESKYHAAVLGRMVRPLPYGLDIWQGNKVFNIEWDDTGYAEVVNFKRGDWEAELLSAAATALRKVTVGKRWRCRR